MDCRWCRVWLASLRACHHRADLMFSRHMFEYWFWVSRHPVTAGTPGATGRMTATHQPRESQVQPRPVMSLRRGSEIDFEDTVPLIFHAEGT